MTLPLKLLTHLDLSAASGLVAAEGRLYVVADDELELGVYSLAGVPERRILLFPDPALPADHQARKAKKPDLEALARLPGDRLLAVGSGSRENRMRCAVVTLGEYDVQPLDAAPLYRALAGDIDELNIEGAAATEQHLYLFQRGNGPSGLNAVIDLDLERVMEAIAQRRPLAGDLVRAIVPIGLPTQAGHPLGFTDASPLPDGRIVFTASAEQTPSTYEDGPVAGSSVGVLGPSLELEHLVAVEGLHKLEGVHASAVAPRHATLLLVADADDRAVPAPLFRAELSW